jgi:uncharacterized protein involved in cysteine biosynthesis
VYNQLAVRYRGGAMMDSGRLHTSGLMLVLPLVLVMVLLLLVPAQGLATAPLLWLLHSLGFRMYARQIGNRAACSQRLHGFFGWPPARHSG